MIWASLQLWSEGEEKMIHDCIVEALRRLIKSGKVANSDEELDVSRKLRRDLYMVRKEMKLVWMLQPEASSFESDDASKPYGHPDFRFSGNTPDYDQFDYDIECKLVRVKRNGKDWDYCEHYVTDGVLRFQNGKYAQGYVIRGTMIGYIQEGETIILLDEVNKHMRKNRLKEMDFFEGVKIKDVSLHLQELIRLYDKCYLSHFWADLR